MYVECSIKNGVRQMVMYGLKCIEIMYGIIYSMLYCFEPVHYCSFDFTPSGRPHGTYEIVKYEWVSMQSKSLFSGPSLYMARITHMLFVYCLSFFCLAQMANLQTCTGLAGFAWQKIEHICDFFLNLEYLTW